MADERRGHSRNRSLLRMFYGISDENKSENLDPMSLDSTAFDKERFIQKQMREKKLTALVGTEVKLKKECERLDGEMKTLVYENYNKFISATDTIQTMQGHIHGMKQKMSELQSKIESISQSTIRINSKFAENRQAIEKYSGISSLLKKRQFLFELPSRLNKCIEMRAYRQAVTYYNRSKEILDKYCHLPSFDSIDKESREIIDNLKEILRDHMNKSSVLPQTVTENVELLLELGEDAEPLREFLVNWRIEDLQKQLVKFSQLPLPPLPAKAEVEKKEKKEPAKRPKTEEEQLFSLDKEDLSPLDEEPQEEKKEELTDEEIHYQRTCLFLRQLNHGFLRELLDFSNTYCELFVKPADASNKALLQRQFEKRTAGLLGEYVTLVTNHLLTQRDMSFVLQCLELLGDSFSQIARENEQEEMNMGVQITNVLGDTLTSYMRHCQQSCFDKMKMKVSVLSRFLPVQSKFTPADAANSAGSHCDRMASEMKQDLDDFLKRISVMLTSTDPGSFLGTHCVRIWRSMNQCLMQVSTFLDDIASDLISRQVNERRGKRKQNDSEASTVPLFLAMVSRLVGKFEKSVIPMLDVKLERMASALKKSNPNHARRINVMDLETLQSAMQSTAQCLLSAFVRDRGTHLSQMIRKGVETPDWSTMKEPSDVRLAVELVAREFHVILRDIEQVFTLVQDAEELPASSSQADLSRYSLSTIQQLTGPKRVPVLGGVIDDNANAIMSSAAKIALKSFVECVRLCTFNKYGYQQMQIDISFLHAIWRELHFDTEHLLERMLDDVRESTTCRCFEPSEMVAKIAQSIVQKKVERYNAAHNPQQATSPAPSE